MRAELNRGDLTETEWWVWAVLLPLEGAGGKRGMSPPPKDNRNIINNI